MTKLSNLHDSFDKRHRKALACVVVFLCLMLVADVNRSEAQLLTPKKGEPTKPRAETAEPKSLSSDDQKKRCREIFAMTTAARSAADMTAVVEACDETLAQPLSEANAKYLTGLKSWAYGRRAVLRCDLAVELQSINPKQSRLILDDALSDANAAIEHNGNRHYGFLYRGLIEWHRGEIDAARTDFAKVTELIPQKSTGWFNLAELEYFAGDFEAAQQHYRKTLEVSPNDQGALNGLVLCCIETGNFDEGNAVCERLLALRPDCRELLVNRAELFVMSGNWEAAYRDFSTALEAEPTPMALDAMAWFLSTCPDGNYFKPETAKKMVKQSIQRAGETPRNLQALAAAQATSGEFEEAIGTIEKALAMCQTTPVAQSLKSRLVENLTRYQSNQPVFLGESN